MGLYGGLIPELFYKSTSIMTLTIGRHQLAENITLLKQMGIVFTTTALISY